MEHVFASDPAKLFGGWVPRPSGMSLRFVAHAPEGHRVREIRVGGEPLRGRPYLHGWPPASGRGTSRTSSAESRTSRTPESWAWTPTRRCGATWRTTRPCRPRRASVSSPTTCRRSSARRSSRPTGRPEPPGMSAGPGPPKRRAPTPKEPESCPRSHPRIVIVGGGTAGITVAARLARRLKRADITVIEPSDKHYYQPLWTLVGAGVFPRRASERDEADFIPKGATWVRDAVAEFRPEENLVLTRDGRAIGYDYLVVAPGIQIDWGKVEGLKEGVGSQRHLQQLRLPHRGLHLGVPPQLPGRHGPVHQPEHAGQVRRGTPEDHVPGRRPLPPLGRARGVEGRLRLGAGGDLPGAEVRPDAGGGDRPQGDRDAVRARPDRPAARGEGRPSSGARRRGRR